MADMHTPLWAVSIQGPDDLIAAADYLTAVRVANAFNVWWAHLKTEQPLTEYDPRMWAVPVEWIGDIDRHAQWVANPSPEYADFFVAPSQDAETIKALREELAQQRAVALQDALNEVEYLRDRISHPNGRRANRIDSMDEQRVEALNDAWDAINSARELALAGSAS